MIYNHFFLFSLYKSFHISSIKYKLGIKILYPDPVIFLKKIICSQEDITWKGLHIIFISQESKEQLSHFNKIKV